MIDDDAARPSMLCSSSQGVCLQASLIRRYVRLGSRPLPTLAEDLLASLSGSASFEPADI
jgi:hypothetical protein